LITEEFLNILPEAIASQMEEASFYERPKYHTVSKRLQLFISLEQPLSADAYDAAIQSMAVYLHTGIDLNIQAKNAQPGIDIVNGYVHYFASKNPQLHLFMHVHPILEQDIICFTSKNEEKVAQLNRGLESLARCLLKVGIDYELKARLVDEDEALETRAIALPPEPAPAPVQNHSYQSKGSYSRSSAVKVDIADLQAGMNNIYIEGHVFDLDKRVLRSEKTLAMIYVSDYKDAIVCKLFENNRNSIELIDSIKKGKTYKLTGSCVYDSYSNTDSFMISSIEEISPAKRIDTALNKRTEFHVHSTFSEMDGVCAIEDYIQQAYDWGMNAIGVVDHQVVQAFPLAQHKVTALNKADPNRHFKMLYGCEMNMVEDHYKILSNNDHRVLEESTYVSFDLETTGLSQRLDEIIEFGAVKMKHREIIDRKQMFINPKRDIPARISNLTHIHQSDVENAKFIEDALDEILEFFGDAVLVAHNAKFDIGFLNHALVRAGREPLKNPVIDTYPLALSMLDIKRYNLGALCRHYGVAYDGEGAHRADYDADVLAGVFCHILNAFEKNATLDALLALNQDSAIRKNRTSHITVYAKNKAGLKELFELITLSHTDYLAYNGKQTENVVAEPRIPRFELEKRHQNGNLFFGSSCQNGEIFDLAHTRSKQELHDAAKFYDFVELQPLDCYRNLLDRGAIDTKAQLIEILRFMIEAADEAGIPVIASSDAHYIHPYQKRVRDIYINSKAIGNARHPLYKYSAAERKSLPAPDQHLRTTTEMMKAFDWLPEDIAYRYVVENPNKLAEQMEEIFPVKDKLYPPDIEGSDEKLRQICYETARRIYGDDLPDIVTKRLDRELNSIIGAGYYVVYYISHLLVKKSNEDGYLVGSRGSVGSSFVATMSGITEVNPLAPHYICKHCHHQEWIEDESVKSGFDLPDKECPVCHEIMRGDGQDIPFETFLGFEGDKVPDIDLNFSGDYQANAHAYTKEVFGEDHVFRAGTVGTVQEKTAYGYVLGYEEEMGLETPYSEAKRVDLAKSCEGVKRTTGQHPGGIVVVPLDMDVHDFTPVQYPANNPFAEWKTTHFDFHQIHDNILKFDILGHVDPTAMKMFERISGIDVTTIPMNDPETMSLFSSTKALKIDSTKLYTQKTGAAGLPEFGTPFVRGILELTKPTTFAELVSISGLSHGTDVWLNNAKDLIDDGTCVLSEVIGCRDDIMVDLMGYGLPPKSAFTIMESVRKGKGLKPDWEELMKEHNVPDWYIDSCKKIKYMFPKAHAVAYVMNAVRIAWFKVHHPLYYYCQYFSIRCDAYDIETMIHGEQAIRARMEQIQKARADKTQKVSDKELAIYDTLELALEMAVRGFHFSNMSITRSDATEFIVDPDSPNAIIPPFTAIDGLGANVGKSIVAARNERAFLSKEDVLRRTQLSKTLLDKMSAMGATEGLDEENQMRLF
jgi:DNA polymerase-3 subunit alpha (Gram-positive type)